MHKSPKFLFILVLQFWTATSLMAQFQIDFETGAVFSGYNDVRIPGDGGTLFSLSEELTIDPSVFFRARIFYDFNPKHHLGLLIAPLSLNSTGQLDRELVFQGKLFPANTPLDATYRFNSYRLIYRYDFLRKERLKLGVGFTAKIRDAEISVRGNGIEGKKTNVGFVPIVHFRLLWNFYDRFGLLLDGDALAAPQGRAEDVMAALSYQLSNRAHLKFGYRALEGGADNDIVYNFALLHYALIGLIFKL
ncbi:MAG: hypothetical protein ONB33_14775 [candidate division KSB1 bacterium]|nr:hypothetical protein [candidate division KSB1 bacterium]MDZ7358858.1 hypothetical protein [candidate division KSB1 bacterium]MDZ7400130.1 hypothetical protein [candidate division KSB1 bacterium]